MCLFEGGQEEAITLVCFWLLVVRLPGGLGLQKTAQSCTPTKPKTDQEQPQRRKQNKKPFKTNPGTI